MIKRILILCVVSLFSLWSVHAVYAADTSLPMAASLTAQQDSDYPLPYPGLLPDNPFYPLKMLRDRIVSFLITNPQKQAEFDLLQADKRLEAGVFLLQKDPTKANLALSTISKGQQYFDDAFTSLAQAQKQRFAVQELRNKFFIAAGKHKEVIGDLKRKIPKDQRGFYDTIAKKSDALLDRAKTLNSQQ